jgi:hypothetical protein
VAEPLTATDVLAAIRRHHARAAVVPELTIRDGDAIDTYTREDPTVTQRRIDALMFLSLERTAIEIKVTVPDFLRETAAKRSAWRRVTHRFVYVAPAGLLTGQQIPYGCGLWEVEPSGRLTVTRKAQINRHPEPLPLHVVQNLAYRACGPSSIETEEDDRG